jgi:hypothetical protein
MHENEKISGLSGIWSTACVLSHTSILVEIGISR